MSHNYVLLTGATGLVGHYLLRDLLCAGHRLAILVRPSRQVPAAERMEHIVQRWERELDRWLPRPVVLTGDLGAKGLGLSEENRRWIAAHCDRILHNAAILTFHGSDRGGEPWRTNVDGTRHVLDLCRRTGLRDFHYVSTAYVCGRRAGVIREDELDATEGFRNDYEHSKYEAERLVRSATFIDPPTIYRPAVIGGDYHTGYTNTYHGLYVYLRLISLALSMTPPDRDGRRHTPFRIAMDGNEQRNVVPVDWVSQVICHLFGTPPARGQTFHLAPRVPLTARVVFEAAYSYYNSYGVEFCGPGWRGSDLNMFEQIYQEHATTYQDYEQTDPSFDTSHLQHFAGHLPCPTIDQEVLHRYWRFGEQDQWGKRPVPKLELGLRAEDVLQQTLSRFETASSAHLLSQAGISQGAIGLDIVGPGGGQWHIRYLESRRPTAVAGLPINGEPVFRLSVDELARLTGVGVQQRGSGNESSPAAEAPSAKPHRSDRLIRTLIRRLDREDRDPERLARRRLPADNLIATRREAS